MGKMWGFWWILTDLRCFLPELEAQDIGRRKDVGTRRIIPRNCSLKAWSEGYALWSVHVAMESHHCS